MCLLLDEACSWAVKLLHVTEENLPPLMPHEDNNCGGTLVMMMSRATQELKSLDSFKTHCLNFSVEIVEQFQTAGYVVFWKHFPAAGFLNENQIVETSSSFCG